MKILPRSTWTDDPNRWIDNHKGALDKPKVEYYVLHWPGDGADSYAGLTQEQVAAKIAGWRKFHVEGRGWWDIGYCYAIDLAGRVWEAAGDYVAAHTAGLNEKGIGVILVLGENDAVSPEMDSSIKALREQKQSEGFPLTKILGHRQAPGAATTCPGPHVMAYIGEGVVGDARPYFVSPAEGRVTSPFGARPPLPFHYGIDIAPPKAGQRGWPVYAAYGGTVAAVNDGSNPNTITGTWNTGSYIKIDGPGGGSEWYGHLDTIDVRQGQQVRAGDRLGTMGDKGQVTGVHLHFETWDGYDRSPHDPMVDFDRYGVKPGSKPVLTSVPAPTPAPKPAPKPKPKHSSGKVPGTNITVVADGVFGTFTKKAYQQALHNAGYRGHKVDGDFGRYSVISEQQWLRDRGQRGHAIDGDRGKYTIRSLQAHLRNLGYTGHAVDGDFGQFTITSLQHALLDGKVK